MKKKSVFGGIVLLIVLSLVCIGGTVLAVFLAGTVDAELFRFRNFNLSNMIPVLIIGCIVSCFVIGIAVLFVGKRVFLVLKDYFSEKNKKEEEK